MDDISDIKALYESGDGEESRLEHHQLERDITLHFFDEYIPAGARVLEIGAATGKYTLWLAERGHTVMTVDLSEKLLEKCKERMTSAGLQKNVSFHVADARNLSGLPEDTPRGGFRGYYCTVSEVAPLHESAGFEKIVLAGVEPAISADDDSYNRLHGKQRQLWLDLLYEVSTEESLVASSRHLLFIGKKMI